VRRGWKRVRDTPPGVQTFECDPYGTDVVPPDVNVPGTDRHAQEQIAIAGQYPGRERSLPSANIIELNPVKR
jgi:hypothetical protein